MASPRASHERQKETKRVELQSLLGPDLRSEAPSLLLSQCWDSVGGDHRKVGYWGGDILEAACHIKVHPFSRKSSRSSWDTTHPRTGYPLFLFPLLPPLGPNSGCKEKKGTLLIKLWEDSVLILYNNVTQQTSFSSTQSAQQISRLHDPVHCPPESRRLVTPTLHHSAPHLKADSPHCLTCIPDVEPGRL